MLTKISHANPINNLMFLLVIIPVLAACKENNSVCSVPIHWLSESETKPDLTPETLVTVNDTGEVKLNNISLNLVDLNEKLTKLSDFDRSELIRLKLSSRLPCAKAEPIINLIDRSAKCKTSSYCKIELVS